MGMEYGRKTDARTAGISTVFCTSPQDGRPPGWHSLERAAGLRYTSVVDTTTNGIRRSNGWFRVDAVVDVLFGPVLDISSVAVLEQAYMMHLGITGQTRQDAMNCAVMGVCNEMTGCLDRKMQTGKNTVMPRAHQQDVDQRCGYATPVPPANT
ncbi:hypothetical protein TOPH_02701 [Tolypocladium ophioglossoides CBS 100239]|uniref:Uncharacterized protein n=1 Tax=Tolypocladium ophioglossoides (strain CBS 100239) TaxID=1163406 RepID=A0A0L0NF29_TOLOC|nr:hypothetical protein TOPH_02701 [Tolypocladium ophioglossoides CBS 100239]